MIDPGPKGVLWDSFEDHPQIISSNEIRGWILHSYRRHKVTDETQKSRDPINPERFLRDWTEIMKKYDRKQLKKYPGSTLGPAIEDDPEYWSEWYVRNQPNFMKEFEDYGILSGVPESEIPRQTTVHQDIISSFLTVDYEPEDSIMRHPEEEFVTTDSKLDGLIGRSALLHDELPPAPSELPIDLLGFHYTLEKWNAFTWMPASIKLSNQFDGVIESFKTDEKWKPIEYPSVFNYYEMLPKYYRDHRLVQSVAMTLERCHPTMSRKHKEIFLNRLCNMLTPKDPEKYRFLQEYFIKKDVLNLDEPQVGLSSGYESDEQEETPAEQLKRKQQAENAAKSKLQKDGKPAPTTQASLAMEKNKEGGMKSKEEKRSDRKSVV